MALLATLVAFVCGNAGLVRSHDSQALRTVGEVTAGVPYTGDIGEPSHTVETDVDDLQYVIVSRRSSGFKGGSRFSLYRGRNRSGNSEIDE